MSDRWAVAVALAAALGAWSALPVPRAIGLALVVAAVALRSPVALMAATGLLTASLAAASWAGLSAPLPVAVGGVAVVRSDPSEAGFQVVADVSVDGRRYQLGATGRLAPVLAAATVGDRLRVVGRVRRFPPKVARWFAPRHLAGRIELTEVAVARAAAGPLAVANRVRLVLRRGAWPLPEMRRPLFTGFVIGDDRGQSPEVEERFRAAGLTHLLVVSGANVAFVLALATPALRSLGLGGRAVGALAVLLAFGLLTRFEPSVLRATAMAGTAVVSTALGRGSTSVRALALAVAGLLVVDPLLVHGLGFRLSVAATAAIALLAPRLAAALPGPRWLVVPLAVTVAAQAGVAPVLAAMAGGVPLAGLPANLLAGPAAGPIMVWGMTAGLVAGLAGGTVAQILHVPTAALVGWIDVVAAAAARLPPVIVGPVPAAAAVAVVLCVPKLVHRHRRASAVPGSDAKIS